MYIPQRQQLPNSEDVLRVLAAVLSAFVFLLFCTIKM